MDFYCIKSCSTCKKAQNWLNERNISYKWVNLKEETPSKETFLHLIENSGRTLKSFFNTSGQKYRELNLKEKLNDISNEEAADLLVSDGMLVKRPFAVDGNTVTSGFKEVEYESTWN